MLTENPVEIALRESRENIRALREFLCSKGLWSDEEERRTIAEVLAADPDDKTLPSLT